MKLSKIPGCLLALCILFANSAALKAQDTWTLQRSVDYALQNNISIKQQDVQKRYAALTLKQSQLAQLPSVGAGIQGTIGSGRNIDPYTNVFVTQSYFNLAGGLNTNVELFNWFYKRNTIAANKYETQAQSRFLEKARNDVAFNIASTFLQILMNIEQVHVSELQVKLTSSQLENTKKLVVAGSVPESNQADLETKLASDSVTLVNAQNQVILTTLQMKALLNLSFDQPYVPQTPEKLSEIPLPRLDEVDPEMVYSAAQNTNPLIKGDDLQIKSRQKAYAAQRGLLYPSLAANGTINTSYTDVAKGVTGKTIPFGDQFSNNFRQSAGLSLNIPILNAWQQRAAVNRAKLDIENQELTKAKDLQQLRQDIYTAHANAVAAIQKYSAASKGVEASQRAYDFATKRYNLGLMNTIDYITTQTNLFRAQIDKVSAQYDFIFRMKLLEFYRDQKITL
ncbi:TolC family protein [Chitinophaga rhizophila]|uniref:TolC family protein n=1 Tax=Chitinophaga rhizophila TaxID=2866212 RepID=A0ABS7GG72_9BACT|nr:TolC family protein [Chitinophaga rhizophila]MBW8686311.1 TolC family protein [Chitinophaga rhizophila]